ncbi:MAG: histidine phosphatase family protein, partial [Candidatus Eremiobacteraeota bacterium]|nr:histidine phosphatase family protein [Candidatus Eremiobacteraeota bacterium]
MLRVALIRHGPTEWNDAGRFQGNTDLPLSPRGEAHARA